MGYLILQPKFINIWHKNLQRMDPGMINESRKLMAKIKDGRTDLGKKDGKTKDRVERWRKNVGYLTG